MPLNLQDALMQASGYLPAAGATSATSLIDTNNSSSAETIGTKVEFGLVIPTLTNTQAISGTQVTYAVWSTFVNTTNTASAIPLYTVPGSLTPTAANSGVTGLTWRFRTPADSVGRYMFATATAAASTVASSATMTLTTFF